MTKIQIELPEATAKAARDAGLLTPQALDRLLTDALKRRQAAELARFRSPIALPPPGSSRCRWKRSMRR